MNVFQNPITTPDSIPAIEFSSSPSNQDAVHTQVLFHSNAHLSQKIGKLGFKVKWASQTREIESALELRSLVFKDTRPSSLKSATNPSDWDLFDDFCEHLIVQDPLSLEVIGTYRVLTPAQAKRVGSLHLETHFDLTRLRQYKDHMVEIGKGCIHPNHRQGGVLLALWTELIRFMDRNQLSLMVGSTPITHSNDRLINAQFACALWQSLKQDHLAPIEFQTRARHPLHVDLEQTCSHVGTPPLIKFYTRMGAKVLGSPSWCLNSMSVDLPMMLHSADLLARYQKHFLGL
jgi:putative hemolysin